MNSMILKKVFVIQIFQFPLTVFEFFGFTSNTLQRLHPLLIDGIVLYELGFISSVSFVIFSSVKSLMQELLMFKLGAATDFPDDLDLRVNFDPKPPIGAPCFNPLLQFDHIGEKKFDQVCLNS